MQLNASPCSNVFWILPISLRLLNFKIPDIRMWVMIMDFETPEMKEYFDSLPPETKSFIIQSGAEISTLGELMEIGEHFRHEN